MNSTEDRDKRHLARMQRKKAIMDDRIGKADREKGIILVNTGNGKGKSSAAFGVAARALGHGMQVGIVQFIKGRRPTGEGLFFKQQPTVTFHVMGEGFTWETQDRQRDVEAARNAWNKARAMLSDGDYDLVVLDELNIVLKHGYLDVNEVVAALKAKPEMQHVIITGRAAKPEIIACADTVTEMKEIKHAFKAGIKAQQGMEL